ncbi:hypothetical protein M422DRAFT_255948 [Sphaerobolus stellatus SS14]|uniref:Terpene synthase n=1 Tax=Sphaerobolus stellatus (strain SS14) TaxID=990650 RepID=A0A0C9VRV8_SPHS4|nr:hypothetical protein M422DRAFT_255948 [Sphaerobolus stellatus SS14]
MSNKFGFVIPDLWAQCPWPAIFHPNGAAIEAESDRWIFSHCPNNQASLLRIVPSLRSGALAAFCYNNCSDERFRLVCDFIAVLFLLDDITDELDTMDNDLFRDIITNALIDPTSYRPGMTNGKEHPAEEPDASRVVRDLWTRICAVTGLPVQQRIMKGLQEYFGAVRLQAERRSSGEIPSWEVYIEHRRLSSACRPLFALAEAGLGIELPEEVVEHPLMVKMRNYTNDWVAISNDIFSFRFEYARNDDHNLIAVMMKKYNLDIQSAVDRVADICGDALSKYLEAKAQFPSYGPEVDAQIQSFLHILQSWMSGNLAWSFVTPRYLGEKRLEIKEHRWVDLSEETLKEIRVEA